MKIFWTRTARQNINDLYDYIAKESPINAERFTDRLVEAVSELADSPHIGKPIAETGNEYIRQRIVQSQRIFYAIDERTSTIRIYE